MGRCLRIGFSYRAGYLKQDVGPPRGLVPLRFRVYLQRFEALEVLRIPGRVESSDSGTGLSALFVVASTLCLPPPPADPVFLRTGLTSTLLRYRYRVLVDYPRVGRLAGCAPWLARHVNSPR